eukprot:CAMPEP_0116023838 /NCGR_PEP_ID=MMETSP0321-20121206/11894_1 /TAXON_ID=163516 /ORGANISM="Leptocylindrus danicus var. danicus, Strain B650" /LENGTH=332 /DNA_ID=CAMNT_0003495323 /DNA_START=147 /DNA_END=1145 /DNA_ORIENTATION=-
MASSNKKPKKNALENLIAGGCAGLVESSICHPLDTIKTRMQLRRSTISAKSSFLEPDAYKKHARKNPMGPLDTAKRIIEKEGFLSLYKGLTAVYSGIIPKMALRFVSFEYYKEILPPAFAYVNEAASQNTGLVTFTAGLMSGLTEAILVVTPAEVCKIRMQSQYHSMVDAEVRKKRKYGNVVQTAVTIVKEEGPTALYKGIVPTMLRQGCNQAVNFTMYQFFKTKWQELSNKQELAPWQHMLIGGISGGFGPTVNNPLDVVKTRMQRQVLIPGQRPPYSSITQACSRIAREEGIAALWKGLTPRLMRIMPGQAITFMTYEFVSKQIQQLKSS